MAFYLGGDICWHRLWHPDERKSLTFALEWALHLIDFVTGQISNGSIIWSTAPKVPKKSEFWTCAAARVNVEDEKSVDWARTCALYQSGPANGGQVRGCSSFNKHTDDKVSVGKVSHPAWGDLWECNFFTHPYTFARWNVHMGVVGEWWFNAVAPAPTWYRLTFYNGRRWRLCDGLPVPCDLELRQARNLLQKRLNQIINHYTRVMGKEKQNREVNLPPSTEGALFGAKSDASSINRIISGWSWNWFLVKWFFTIPDIIVIWS